MPFDSRAHVGEDRGFDQRELLIGIGAAGIEHDDLAADAAALLLHRLALADVHGIALAHRAGEALEGPVGSEAAGAIGLEADVALELAEGRVGEHAEHTVGAPAVEPHARVAPGGQRDRDVLLR